MMGFIVLTLALPVANGALTFQKAEAEISQEIHVNELKAHVYRLASPEFKGRKGPGGARAARHIAKLFQRMKLQPLFGDSYFQPIPNYLKDPKANKAESYMGRNVGAFIPGTDPKLKDEWILLSAHFDHLGIRKGKLYPGADDNASGVAMLIEVAEKISQGNKTKRTIVFVSFDLEEAGLLGSRYFAVHSPKNLKKLKAFMTADMLGRSMANLMDEYFFVLGSETSPELLKLTKSIPPAKGLKIGRLGADIIGTRSDYGPFRDRKIPFLFFSTGQHPDYHSPRDLPDRVDFFRLQKICDWITKATCRLANDAESPSWSEKPILDLAEVQTIQTLLERVLKNPKSYPLNKQQRQIVERIDQRLASILDRGKMTRNERTWLIWTSRILLATVF